MVSSVGFWAFIIANMGPVVAGGILATLSYVAYRRNGQSSYRLATIGFGLVVAGSLVHPAFLFSWSVNFQITGQELLLLSIAEDIMLTAGLGIIFLAITRHKSSTSSTKTDSSTRTNQMMSWGNDNNNWDD